jgi:hypothetical protein
MLYRYCRNSCRSRPERRASSSAYCARSRENSLGLQVPALLGAAEVPAQRGPIGVEQQLSGFRAPQVLALQLELPARGIAVRRPFQCCIDDPGSRLAAEGVAHRVARGLQVLVATILRPRIEPRQPGAPAGRIADVAADVREQRQAVEAVAVATRRREGSAVAGLRTELDEQIGRRQPLELQTVLMQLRAVQRLVRERLVGEIPGVGVHLIEVAGRRQEAPALERESGRQRGRTEVRLLHRDLVVARHRCGQIAVEIRVDAGRQCELRFAQAEVALAGSDLAAVRHEAGNRVVGRIARQVGIGAAEDDRDGRVEGGGAAAADPRCRRRLHRRRCLRRGVGRRLQLCDALLQGSDALGVFGLELIDRGAQRRDVIGGATRRRHTEQGRQASGHHRHELGHDRSPRRANTRAPHRRAHPATRRRAVALAIGTPGTRRTRNGPLQGAPAAHTRPCGR